jgi:hypothetical protein
MTALERTLHEVRSVPPLAGPKRVRPTRRTRLTLTEADYVNLRAVRDAWNRDRVVRGLECLSLEAVLSKGLEAAAGWLAGKDGT